jgi:hypothetical protein
MFVTFSSHRVTQIEGAMTLRCFWNCQGVDRRKPEKYHEDPKVIQRVPEGVRSCGELNKEVIDII